MERDNLKTMPGVSSKETTAVTMKTIKELIAEEEAEQRAAAAKAAKRTRESEAAQAREMARKAEAVRHAASASKSSADVVPKVQQPPHATGHLDTPPLPADTMVDQRVTKVKPTKSLFERLFGR